LAYLRTSSATNVDGDSAPRQREAILAHARHAGFEVVGEFYDAAVSGADHIQDRPGFADMLARIEGNGVRVILVETASRFARDLAVQLAGHELLRKRGIDLIPVDAPSYFTDPSPTAEMVRQILGAVAQFQKASLVAQMRGARDRASKVAGRRIEGRKPTLMGDALAMARRLRRRNPKNGERRSLRDIAAELAEAGHLNPATGKAYSAEAIRLALAPKDAA
jgi:DNA invertase Pin-like site-specific DNA recombinase